MAAKERAGDEQPTAERQHEQPPPDVRMDVKSEVAQKLIAAMEQGETPWQKPWSSQAMRPRNPVTGNFYRGVNRLLLSLVGGSGLFVTYQQAQAQGWQVRKGEKGTMIVKVVDLDADRARNHAGANDARGAERPQGQEQARRNVILRRYYVFGSNQIDGMPDLAPSEELDFHPVEKAEAIVSAFQEKTGLRVLHGKRHACYVPEMDEVHLPNKKTFKSVYDYYATALHELGHSTLHAKRLDRKEALGKRWGDEAYSLEELRAELYSAIVAAELGIEMTEQQRAKHLANHAGYLQSWIKALRSDPMAIFTAARDADRMVEYTLALERQATAMQEHAEWVAEYEAAQVR
jgi:antirestriction protein ArdC